MVFLAFSGYRGGRFPTDNAGTRWPHFRRRNEARGERGDRHDASRGMGYRAAARR